MSIRQLKPGQPTLALLACFIFAIAINVAFASDKTTPAEFFLDLAPDTANEALAKIPDLGRKLLALRSYIRAGARLEDRWSWTKEEIVEFQGSAKQLALLAEVAAINAHFSEAQPGYSLHANTKVRSLDVQIRRWNKNGSVKTAADEILAEWKKLFGSGDAIFADLDTKGARNWLARFRNTTRARLAAPGLTLHGQANAIDFQIMKSGTIVVGTNSKHVASVWEASGWVSKLKQSVEAAGPSFKGPLMLPFEPWHYEYDPKPEVVQSK